ncbi:hypothetical protein OAU60_01575, partial [Euryarchaeota archaeon]|nr:hypothetical protein [Euryarchaeota archaeon]
MSGGENNWKPAALSRIESEEEAPNGFKWLIFAGIGLKSKMLEPINPNDWKMIISNLEPWGEIPNGEIVVEEVIDTDKGINLKLNYNDEFWLAEFFPWGTDGRFRARISLAPTGSDVPIGGYTWNGMDILSLKKWNNVIRDTDSKLHNAISSNDLEKSKQIIFHSSAAIGRYHKAVENARVTPNDSKRWNQRLANLEALLRANIIWRAPHTRDTVCVINLGDIRFADMINDGSDEYKIHFSRPRLADSIIKPECEFPAIRDFSSLLHDLNRIYFSCDSKIKMSDLRLALIEGWRST